MPILPTVLILVMLCASSLLGFWLRQVLWTRHFDTETVASVRVVISMLVTFAAIVLGLLTSSAKGRFDGEADTLRRFGVNLIQLDQRLREYGPEADPARVLLRSYTAATIVDAWPNEPRPAGAYPIDPDAGTSELGQSPIIGGTLDRMDRMIETLTPGDPYRMRIAASLRSRAADTIQTRWTLHETTQSTLSWPFLSVLMVWLVIMFAMFGLSAPRNRVMYTTILFCSLSIASTLFLILDYDGPYDGLLALSSEPMRDALAHMDAPA